jgi:mono/diheme cytochrome c family protein
VTVRGGASLLMLMAALVLMAAWGLKAAWIAPSWAAADDDFAYGRRLFLDKAECSFCHGWAGDGSGQPQSPGRAANLRKSQLGRDALVTTILCGIPGTAMPHFDELAYTDKRCYGMTEAELGGRTPTFPPSTTLQRREVEVIADYLLARVIGHGEVTREECLEAFGAGTAFCNDYRAKP